MNGATSLIWISKAGVVWTLVLALCWTTPRLIRNIPEFPPVTTDEAQSDIIQRYFELPVATVALTGSSFTMRLREEFFQNLSVRNFALPGGSPLTGAAVIEAADSIRPRFVAIETNVLSRGIDRSMVDKFRMGRERTERMLKPFRTIAAVYQRKLNFQRRFDTNDRGAMLQERTREQMILHLPPAAQRDEVPIAITFAEWNKADYDEVIVNNAAELRRFVEKLEAKGATVFLYEIPIDPALERSRFMKAARSALADAFGPDNHRWLLLQYPTDELRWVDGAHLDERSAILIARSLERSIEQKIAHGEGGAREIR